MPILAWTDFPHWSDNNSHKFNSIMKRLGSYIWLVLFSRLSTLHFYRIFLFIFFQRDAWGYARHRCWSAFAELWDRSLHLQTLLYRFASYSHNTISVIQRQNLPSVLGLVASSPMTTVVFEQIFAHEEFQNFKCWVFIGHLACVLLELTITPWYFFHFKDSLLLRNISFHFIIFIQVK